jgi:hypothetical protein
VRTFALRITMSAGVEVCTNQSWQDTRLYSTLNSVKIAGVAADVRRLDIAWLHGCI